MSDDEWFGQPDPMIIVREEYGALVLPLPPPEQADHWKFGDHKMIEGLRVS